MVLPDWIINILVALGLKKSPDSAAANLKEELRELNASRSRMYEEMEKYQRSVDILSTQKGIKAQSDLTLMKGEVDDLLQSLAVVNGRILQIRKIMHLRDIDKMAEKTQNLATELKIAIARAEQAGVIMEDNNEAIREANSIKFADPTLANAPAAAEQVSAPQETAQAKNEKPVSEINSENV